VEKQNKAPAGALFFGRRSGGLLWKRSSADARYEARASLTALTMWLISDTSDGFARTLANFVARAHTPVIHSIVQNNFVIFREKHVIHQKSSAAGLATVTPFTAR